MKLTKRELWLMGWSFDQGYQKVSSFDYYLKTRGKALLELLEEEIPKEEEANEQT